MSSKPENCAAFMLDVKELTVELDNTDFIPEWFQTDFGGLIHEIIKTHILEMGMWHQVIDDELVLNEEEETNEEEYVNWSNISEINHYTITGNIKYRRTKVFLEIYISKGDSIKFKNSFEYDIDSLIENMNKILNLIRDFILQNSGNQDNNDISINHQQYYPEIIKILEAHKNDQTPEKLFITGLFYAKAGNEEKSLENLDMVITNPANPDLIQECYKVILAVKARKSMKDLENAQKEVYSGDPNKAIPLIESLIQITPKYVHLHFLLGMACKRSGNRQKAIEAFRNSIEIDPNYSEAIRELAEELVAIGSLQDAEDMYRKIIALNKATAADYYNLGMCLKRMGKKDELDSIIEKIKELDTEGRFDSIIFSLFEIHPEYSQNENSERKPTFWTKLFSKK